MKPCPDCGKTLNDDPEWQYCPFCGTALERDSDIAKWRWIATYETLGEGAYVGDELKRRGIASRLREQTVTRPPYFVVQAEYAMDVEATSFDAAAEAIAALKKRDDLDEDGKEDVPPSQSASRQAAFMIGLMWILIIGAGMAVGVFLGLASCVDRDLFRS
jgi:hypothetical protein